MSFLSKAVAALAAIYVGWQVFVQPTYEHRYRVQLSVETPEGVRTASSVWAVSCTDAPLFSPAARSLGFAGCRLRGEAVFLELPGGRNLVALMARGPKGDDVDLYDTAPAAFEFKGGGASGGWYSQAPRWTGWRVLTDRLIPTLVTFTDVTNPASAQVVYATGTQERRNSGGGAYAVGKVFEDRFTALYGPGFALKEVRLEMVSAGIWPFNLLPVPFPQALFGTPITTGIEGKLPMLVTHREPLRRMTRDMPPRFQAGFSQFIRE
jgi:hypothetical protein